MKKPVIEREDMPLIRVSPERLVGLPYEYMLRGCDRAPVNAVLHYLNPAFRTYLEGTAVRNLIDSYPDTYGYDEVEIVAVAPYHALRGQISGLIPRTELEKPLILSKVKGRGKISFMVERAESSQGEKFALTPVQGFWRRLFRMEEQSPIMVDLWDAENFKGIGEMDF